MPGIGYEAFHFYKCRLKIETLFKHLKSAGLYPHKTRLKYPKKLAILIIVVAVSVVSTFCMGFVIKGNEPSKSFQLVSCTKRPTAQNYPGYNRSTGYQSPMRLRPYFLFRNVKELQSGLHLKNVYLF